MKHAVKLRPFTVPNFVLTEQYPGTRENGFAPGPKFALSELEPETLSELCDAFRRDVFQKAGKPEPKKENA